MPAIVTHDLFGQDAFGSVLDTVGLYTPDERDAFLLGNQGPDPLFYLKMLPPLVEFERLGTTLHHECPSELLVSLRRAADAIPEPRRSVARAYVAGFVCHYLLDRAVHPFVFFWERGICEAGVDGLDLGDHNVVHAEIERELDEMMLFAKRNQTVKTYKPYKKILIARDETLETCGALYFDAVIADRSDEREPTLSLVFPLAVRCYRVIQNLFYDPSGRSTRVLEALEKPLFKSRYSLARAMTHRARAEASSDFDNRDHRPWRNPFTGVESTSSFTDLYDGALAEVGGAVAAVFSDDFDLEASRTLTGGLNFSGEPVE